MADATILPLEGFRVLDMTTVVFGPYTTMMMGDFGAEVIKIEPPGGDMTRAIGPTRNPGMSSLFLGANRNKKSMVLDLKRDAARSALWRLIDSADMLVHNVRPQAIARLGFDPDSVLAHNPGIIYGALHGYREEGPYGGRPAYDDVIQGESGLAGTFTVRDGAPVLNPSVIADKTAALLASTGLLAALVQRLRTGKGLYLETSMFEGLAAYTLLEHQHGMIFSPAPEGYGYPRAMSPARRPHQTRDGFICMLAYTDRQWARFWEIAGKQELGSDPRFATMRARSENIDALYSIAGEVLTGKTTAEWLDILKKAEIPCGPVNTLEDLREDEQLQATGFFRSQSHPTEGHLEALDTAFRLDRKTLPLRVHQPRLGEHGAEILGSLGYESGEIEEILKTGDSA
ncbi:MAG: CoA transferase [Pseudomonadota bacterium]